MLYCEKCRELVGERCDKKGHSTRTPRDDDPVLLWKADSIQAGQLEDLLRQQHIPFLREGMLGAAMTTWTGPMMELYRFYVPYAHLDQANAVAMVFQPAEEPPQEEA